MYKKHIQEQQTNMAFFFTSAFFRTGFMVFIATGLGIFGRLSAPFLFSNGMAFIAYFIVNTIIIFLFNSNIQQALTSYDKNKLGLYSYLNTILFGFMGGVITSIYHLDLIAQALFTTGIIFGITTTYGYFTKQDMSSLKTIITILFWTCSFLSLIGMIMLFIKPSISRAIFSIESLISLVLNIIFIVYTMDVLKNFYKSNKNNPRYLEVVNIYASYSLFINIFNIFLNILRLLSHRKRDN